MNSGYAAAYTHKVASQGEEARLLVAWLAPLTGTLVVVAPQKTNFEYADFLGRLGLARAPRLTQRSLRDLYQYRPAKVLALWPTSKLLGEIDATHAVSAMAVLSWTLDEIAPWCAARSAVDVLDLAPTAVGPVITDPAVHGAMIEITRAVNMSAPLSHPSDHDRVVSAFRLLHRHGHRWHAEELAAWALAHGWEQRHVDVLVDKTGRIAQGRVVHLKSRGEWFDTSAIARWIAHVDPDHE